MSYAKLNQARALSRRRTEQVGIIIPEIPALNGKLAQIDPEGTRQFNAVMDRMIRNIAEQIQKLPVDLSPEVLQFLTTTVQTAVAEAVAALNIAQNVTNVTQVTQVASDFQSLVGALATPEGVVVGNVGWLYKSDPAIGGTGEGFTKCSGNGTSVGWR